MRMIIVDKITRGTVVLALAFSAVALSAGVVSARDYYRRRSYLTLEIELEKPVFEFGEPVYGYVNLRNSYGTIGPVTFEIQLFHDGYLAHSLETEVAMILPGRTKLSFQDLGIFQVISPGRWWIWIIQKDVDPSYGVLTEFTILGPGKVSERREEKKY